MFGFLCRTLRCSAPNIQNSSCFPEIMSLVLIRGLSASSNKISKAADQQQQHSFTVSYLVNKCGLPLKTATSASQMVHFESSEGPDSVLAFLKNHGFSDTQIAKLITRRPRLVCSDPEETLLPKIEFFNSIGITGPDFTRILTQNPNIWFRSVKKRLAPCYDFIKSVVLSEDKAVTTLKGAPRMLMCDMQTSIAPNIALLRKFGVSQSTLLFLVTGFPNLLLRTSAKFEKHVREVLDMGFDPKKSEFVHALRVFAGISKLSRERKMAVYRRFGWSDHEILSVLKTHPMCLMLSEKKIMDGLDFLMNKMGWQRKAVARVPLVLCYSLNKRVIPRCAVVQVLQSEGLLKEADFYLSSVLIPSERVFLARFVIKYEEQVPQLLNVYKGKLGLPELGFGSEGMKQL
ncbi:hypothetical protein PVL29_008565 [Vitis rotundifolia]|uniref:Uncharacterized protein n=1 Tax=Vitis rotundifolia TaxID=103349 RepID=A0AA38ZWD7_VITRO|nr:hypothetical protein PVL29_008565 [Vitis rotundifolia]